MHHRPFDPREPVGSRPVAPLGGDEVAVEPGQLGRRVGASRDRERIVGQRLVERQQVPATPSRLRYVAAGCRDLGVERVRERQRRHVAVSVEDLEGRFEVGVDRVGLADLHVDEGPAGERHGAGGLGDVTGTREGLIEPALAFDGGTCQPVRPARPAGDRQRRLGVVGVDRPLERRTQVVHAPHRP